ncbi:hypothetical protein SLA2020_241430 [Shorea laevis]
MHQGSAFCCGKRSVCDDLEEAKVLSWIGERFKVVTVDGIVLTKSGTMMGGTSGGMEARSNKWDDKKIEGPKKKKEQHESDLEKLGSIREMQLKESEISDRISGLERKIQYGEIKVMLNDLHMEQSSCLLAHFVLTRIMCGLEKVEG